MESLIEMFERDEALCSYFMEECFKEDNCDYLFEIMLESTD